jgi:hypothetical protein
MSFLILFTKPFNWLNICCFQGPCFITITTRELVWSLGIQGFTRSLSGYVENLPEYIEPLAVCHLPLHKMPDNVLGLYTVQRDDRRRLQKDVTQHLHNI